MQVFVAPRGSEDMQCVGKWVSNIINSGRRYNYKLKPAGKLVITLNWQFFVSELTTNSFFVTCLNHLLSRHNSWERKGDLEWIRITFSASLKSPQRQTHMKRHFLYFHPKVDLPFLISVSLPIYRLICHFFIVFYPHFFTHLQSSMSLYIFIPIS